MTSVCCCFGSLQLSLISFYILFINVLAILLEQADAFAFMFV